MDSGTRRRLICALDTGDLTEALETIRRTKDFVGAYKVGHGLTLPHGLGLLDRLREAGAERIFLDLKFHDIPNSVAVGVREAARAGVWMLTLHLSGGPAMISAAVEEAAAFSEDRRPLIMGVSVLTSLSPKDLTDYLGVGRTVESHMLALSRLGVRVGLDGVITSVEECPLLRRELPQSILVTPGIRPRGGDLQDQTRVGDGKDALEAGADYLVIGRALTSAADPIQALRDLRLAD
ncbi:MAG: orotidine-5'-phosphate decarboxylase [Fimbriimonadaceae bacterium]|nr:orotidine-5'-phosphate decarboxylase [Fimbriimonadaceae bacterium]